jgi:hypothetical protein
MVVEISTPFLGICFAGVNSELDLGRSTQSDSFYDEIFAIK